MAIIMDVKVADHLDKLWKEARPRKISSDGLDILCAATLTPKDYSFIHDNVDSALRLVFRATANGSTVEAWTVEIRDAAKERRLTNPDRVVKLSWELAKPAMAAYLDGDNASRLAAYEAYRAACEQGVAIPPPTA